MRRTRVLTLAGLLYSVLVVGVPASALPLPCGFLVTSDLTLTEDLDCSGVPGATGLKIVADGVTVDLNGYSIIGDPFTTFDGIRAEGRSDITIKNGEITGFDKAIVFDGTSDSRIRNMTIRDNSGGVIFFEGSNGNRLKHSMLEENGDGSVSIVRSHDNKVVDVEIRDRRYGGGINIGSAGRTRVAGSLIEGHIQIGGGSKDTTLIRNRVIAPTTPVHPEMGPGITVYGAVYTLIKQNEISGFPTGVRLVWDSRWTTLAKNRVHDNGVGLELTQEDSFGIADWLDGSVVRSNQFYGNGAAGIFGSPEPTDSLAGVEITRNRLLDNGYAPGGVTNDDGGIVDDGLHLLRAGPGITVTSNRAKRNADYGIQAVGVTDGGFNQGRRNGNPAQCLGVTCS